MQAGIIGLGLIGGSMGLALRESKIFKRILGFDTNALHSRQALSLGLVDECVEFEQIQECDVIFIATPLDGIIATLQKLKPSSPTTTIIDLGGAKKKILDSIPQNIRKNFVAAHPMSGTENYGPNAAEQGLFHNKIVILTDIEQSGEYQVALAKQIFIAIGMRLISMSAIDHDRHVAFISHLPHIISFALANAVLAQEEPQNILALIGGGFKGMSRLAKSSPIMWRDVFAHNKQNLLEAIDHFGKEMLYAEKLVQEDKWDDLIEWMKKANTLHTFL
ncbi:prephenate dehydrogenase [Helicobacter zhangjianzhongii]|uniref:Prephenate dehydrogenase n=1 Tax=Helicobacter zhangjianzhongii TaxID=2974574 RepID=A0ACC6FPL2_9HELI|nr:MULTISPECIES: prephenate dehydrogenase [unclassified Helicobacter]MDL0079127.1 prephenate dehydrogenase [Helicobacter sp. CPD2-1]MDL0081155.1 prephenate dehydrogenase [Helicobacter sp. XJK30-2]